MGRSMSRARGIGPNLVDCHVSGRECRARSSTTGAKQPGGCSIGEVNAAPNAYCRSSGGMGRSRSRARGIGPNLVDCHVSGRECRARSTTTGAKQPGGCSIGEVNAAPNAYCLGLG
jgi:hypothetical protein